MCELIVTKGHNFNMLKTKSLSWAYGGFLCVFFFSNHPPSSKGKKLQFFSLPTLVFPQLTQLRASLHGDWDDTDFCVWRGSWDRRYLTVLEGQYIWTLSGLFKVWPQSSQSPRSQHHFCSTRNDSSIWSGTQ